MLTLPEVTDLEHLDFDLSCHDFDGCDARADWWMVCLACGFHNPLCDRHKRMTVEFTDRYAWNPFATVVCDECKVTVAAPAWRTLCTFVPVGGA